LSTRKIQTLLATVATAFAVAVVPASSQAVRAQPTGDRALDDYCNKAAALIDRALTESHLALINGDDEGFAEWSALVVEMVKRSEARGCSFSATRKIRRILREAAPDVGPIQTEPGTSSGGTSTGGTGPRTPDTSSPPVGGPMG
jgi:uncharacterized membrane protein YccC